MPAFVVICFVTLPARRRGVVRPNVFQPKNQLVKVYIQTVALVLLLLLYLAVALAHTFLAPLTTGPDELAHYEYVRFIAEHGRLPLNKDERGLASYKSDQPPLYHLLAALPASLVDGEGPPYLKRVGDHARRQLIERTRHAWGLYNTEDELWPYRAEVLRWQVGRWVAVLFGALTVALTFFIARNFFDAGGRFPGWLPALGAAMVVAFIPRFALTGSMLNYETTLAFFMALLLGVMLKMAGSTFSLSASRFRFYAVMLGLLAGLAISTKLSAIILPLELLVVLWLLARYYGWTRAGTWQAAGLALLGLAAGAGWWFAFIVYQFNTVAQDGLWVGLLRPLVAADASDATTNRLLNLLTGGQAGFTGAIDNLEAGPLWQWLFIFFRTFWMVGIETVQPLAPLGLVVVLAGGLLALVGLVVTWRSRRAALPIRLEARPALALLLLHLGIPLVLPLLRYAITWSLADTAQGRHLLFPAAPAFAILWVWGLGEVVVRSRPAQEELPRPWLTFAFLAPGLFLLAWTGVQLWTMTWAYNPLLPVRTVPEAAAQAAYPVNQAFNDFVTLAGYSTERDPEGRVLRLDLLWQATGGNPVDYLTEVSLVDEAGQVLVLWLGYPANGRYPTRAWDVGDVVRDTAWLPLAGLEPGQYQLHLQLVPTNLFPPLDPAPSLEAPLLLTTLALPDAPLRHFNGSLPFTGLAATAAGYSVWQNGQELAVPRVFRYRETVMVTLSPLLPGQERTVRLVGPRLPGNGEAGQPPVFEPVRVLADTALFIVGPDWPAGDYHLAMTMDGPNLAAQQVNSGQVLEVVDLWQRQFDPPPVSRPVEANFANQVKLVGYDLGANRAAPGEGFPLTLVWQGLDWMGEDYTFFTKLLAADGTVYGGRERLAREGYSTLYWAPGEIVVDPFGVPVAAETPPGVYTLNIGLYKQVGQQAISLPLVENGRPIGASSITIGPVKVGGPPPGLTLASAQPQVSLNQPFGDEPNLTLLGYDLEPLPAGRPVEQLDLTLTWQSNAPLPVDYNTFVHVRNAAGETVAQKDQPPLQGAYPVSLWDPGEIVADKITIPLPANLPDGSYSIIIGMYDLRTGLRLAVPGTPDNGLVLTTMEFRR